MYILLGGNIHEITAQSELEAIKHNEDDSPQTRKKGRPKKVMRRSQSHTSKQLDKLTAIRYDMEQVRMISDLVKRR